LGIVLPGAYVIKEYHGNLLAFHGNYQVNVDLWHKITVLPVNGNKLPWIQTLCLETWVDCSTTAPPAIVSVGEKGAAILIVPALNYFKMLKFFNAVIKYLKFSPYILSPSVSHSWFQTLELRIMSWLFNHCDTTTGHHYVSGCKEHDISQCQRQMDSNPLPRKMSWFFYCYTTCHCDTAWKGGGILFLASFELIRDLKKFYLAT
jgi:hypothetical protein